MCWSCFAAHIFPQQTPLCYTPQLPALPDTFWTVTAHSHNIQSITTAVAAGFEFQKSELFRLTPEARVASGHSYSLSVLMQPTANLQRHTAPQLHLSHICPTPHDSHLQDYPFTFHSSTSCTKRWSITAIFSHFLLHPNHNLWQWFSTWGRPHMWP